jgi:multidrug efflux pump subunit AcrA (membrane-fusion protein)
MTPRARACPMTRRRDAARLGLLAALAAVVAGCERPTAATTGGADTKDVRPPTRVETVRSARMTLRRTIEEPGHVEAFESAAIHAKIAGFVRSWGANIGSKVANGQVLAVLDVPEVEADAEQERAMVEQAEAHRDQAEAAVKVAQADIVSAEARAAEARAGTKRSESDYARWQSESRRVEQLFQERAQTGSLLDETRNKLLSAEAAREEVEAQVKTAEATLRRAAPGWTRPAPTSSPPVPASWSPAPRPAAPRRCWAMPGSWPPSTGL